MPVLLYNTLTRRKDEFVPLDPPQVRIYSCGPTVYRFAHIGNMRTFLMADILRRVLTYNGLQVFQVQNITDVGHMTEEELDAGEDKMLMAARQEGKTPWEIAAFYTEAFLRDKERMNMLHADLYPRATDHIAEMQAMVQTLLDTGHAYRGDDTIYFDIGSFPEYGKLSGNRLEKLQAGLHRVARDPRKRNPEDFALWKGAEPGRLMVWDSPWGKGYPGWHIECSAMSSKYLGPQFDIHTGGIDNVFPHHEDEIAQSEACFGLVPARFWMYGEHLLAEDRRMAKSARNYYILSDMEERGFDPLAFRFLCLQAHYRAKLNFTWDALAGTQRALEGLRGRIAEMKAAAEPTLSLSGDGAAFREEFRDTISDDLDTARAIAILWEALKSDLPAADKLALALDFDQVLGLRLDEVSAEALPELSLDLRRLVEERDAARKARDWPRSDALRDELLSLGFEVQDTPEGTRVKARQSAAGGVA